MFKDIFPLFAISLNVFTILKIMLKEDADLRSNIQIPQPCLVLPSLYSYDHTII